MQTVNVRPISVDSKLKHVNYLEQALNIWHDYWYVWAMSERVSRGFDRSGVPDLGHVTTNYPQLRSFLLGSNSASEFAVGDFIPPEGPKTKNDDFLTKLPLGMKNWCANSRRVYQLDSELQAVLEVTSLKSMLWSDVRLPFPTIGIELATPYVVNGFSIDFVLVDMAPRSEHNDGRFTIWFFDRKQLDYEPISAESKRSAEQLFRDRKLQTLGQRLVKRAHKIADYHGAILHFSFRDEQLQELEKKNFLASKHATAADKIPDANQISEVNKMMRIIIGLPLYLKSLPSGSPHVVSLGRKKNSAPAQTTGKSCSITEEADIFRISASFKLTREERVFLELEGTAEERAAAKRELCCHFREGYWRRPRGQGKNPDAEKTEEVRFTIVRRDKLKEGQLPAGSAKLLD